MENQSISAEKNVALPSLGLFGILMEALSISIRNGKLLLFNIFIFFLYCTIIRLADLVTLKVGALYFAYTFIVLCLGWLILLFSVTASVHSTFEAYTAAVLSLKEMLSGVVTGRWRRASITSVWMIIIIPGSAALIYFVFYILLFMTDSGQYITALSFLASVVTIGGGCCLVYLCSLLMLSLVASVIEDDMSGLKAITEASQIMKGKELQGFMLMVLLVLAGVAIFGAFYYLQGKIPVTKNAKLAVAIDLTISVLRSLAFCIWILFAFVVYTLFYHECKVRKLAALYNTIAAVDDN